MNINRLVLVSSLAALIVFVCLVNCQEGGPATSGQNARSKVALPKIFDFERFKQQFRKGYSSVIEELARKKIFLGRAFRVFLSFVGYKHRRNNHYLKISDRSDWTEAEFQSTLNPRGSLNLNGLKVLEDEEEQLKKTPVASIEDIEAKFREIRNKPEFADLAQELDRASVEEFRSRRRRDVSKSGRADLKIDDLFGRAESNETEPLLEEARIPSNNPDYKPPELASYGSDQETDDPMDVDDATIISSLPGASYINGLFSTVSNLFFGPTPEPSIEPKLVIQTSLPDEVFVDHRESGCFNEVRNQRRCGSCYIFSTIGLYEWQFCQEAGKRIALSEQYPLDCGERGKLKGCKGGLEWNVASFFGTYGLELKSNYPYRMRSDICPYSLSTKPKNMGYLKLKDEDGSMILIKHRAIEKYLASFAMIMGVTVPTDFSDYGGGVDDAATCTPKRGHSMVLVGHGREDGEEYWLFRNSYGPSWGEDGHYKMNKKAKHCLMDEGMGMFLQPKEGNVFDLQVNPNYYPEYVKNRYYEVLLGKDIQVNPYTYVSQTNGVVAPK